MKSANFIYHCLYHFIPTLISIACFGYVVIKVTDCLRKFQGEPITNTVSFQDNRGLPFPVIAACPRKLAFGVQGKGAKEALKACNLTESLYNEGHWIGNCTDPEQLYNSITAGQTNLTSRIVFRTKDGQDHAIREEGLVNKPIDSFFGRCYSMVPEESVLNQGIVELSLRTEHKNLQIFVSSNGELLTGKYG